MTRENSLKVLILTAMAVCAMLCAVSDGRTIYVDDNGPTNFATIQAAVDDANDGDVVIVKPGRYTGDSNRDIDFKGKAITVRSTDPNDSNTVAATVIDCGGTQQEPHRGFHLHTGEGPNAIIAGLTIMNGYADLGGAIHCGGNTSPLISRCVIRSNRVTSGGGGISVVGQTRIEWCTIVGNSAVSVEYASFPCGGGVCCSGSPIITHCLISNNSADWEGGAIYYGGGGTALIENCVIAGNRGFEGGGVCITGGKMTIGHCTIANNQPTGIWSEFGGCEVSISHSIVWHNATKWRPEIGISIAPFLPFFVKVSYNNIEGGQVAVPLLPEDECYLEWGPNNISEYPLFADANQEDFHLTTLSPCIEAGDPCLFLAVGEVDIDSQPRVNGDRPDIGAYEFAFVDPFIGVSSPKLTFYSEQGGPNPRTQALLVRNLGGGTMKWMAEENCVWLEVSPQQGESSGQASELKVNVNSILLNRGIHTCEILVHSEQAANISKTIAVELRNRGTLQVPADYAQIQAAIDAAVDGEEIVLAPGTYTGYGNMDIDFRGKAITLRSIAPDDAAIVARTVVDCQGCYRAFFFHSQEGPESVLRGITITGGMGRNERFGPGTSRRCGGGIYCVNSSPTIIQCRIVGNNATERLSSGLLGVGGGIACQAMSKPLISQCLISNNSAGEFGGGLVCRNSGPTISYCRFMGNDCGNEGAGIYSNGGLQIESCEITGNFAGGNGGGVLCKGNLTVEQCLIVANRAGGDGGGVYSSSLTYLAHSTIAGNSAANGGGLRVIYGGLNISTLAQCIIADNTASAKGGGIFVSSYGTRPLLNCCTIEGNSAAYGGGVYAEVRSHPRIENSIIWDNIALDGSQIGIVDAEATVSYSDVQGGPSEVYVADDAKLHWGQGNMDADPVFIRDAQFGLHLKSQAGRWDPNSQSWVKDDVTSPCIDAGDPNSDWTAELWPHGKRINMGAYGGTAEASMSLSTVGSAGDLNHDNAVNLQDVAIFVEKWLVQEVLLAEDIDRNGAVDFRDLAGLLSDLSWQDQ